MTQKEIDYASKTRLQLLALFDESNENHIDKNELKIGDNFHDFCEGLQRACKSIIDGVKDEMENQ